MVKQIVVQTLQSISYSRAEGRALIYSFLFPLLASIFSRKSMLLLSAFHVFPSDVEGLQGTKKLVFVALSFFIVSKKAKKRSLACMVASLKGQ